MAGNWRAPAAPVRRLLDASNMTVEELLRRQHVEMRERLLEVRHAPHDRVRVAFEALADAVELHSTLEERHLHPLLQVLGHPDIDRSIEAHRALRHVVREFYGRCDAGAQFLSALEVLAAQLEQHIVGEERTVLPYLARALSDEREEAVAHAMLETIAEIENESWLGAPDAWVNHSPAAY